MYTYSSTNTVDVTDDLNNMIQLNYTTSLSCHTTDNVLVLSHWAKTELYHVTVLSYYRQRARTVTLCYN